MGSEMCIRDRGWPGARRPAGPSGPARRPGSRTGRRRPRERGGGGGERRRPRPPLGSAPRTRGGRLGRIEAETMGGGREERGAAATPRARLAKRNPAGRGRRRSGRRGAPGCRGRVRRPRSRPPLFSWEPPPPRPPKGSGPCRRVKMRKPSQLNRRRSWGGSSCREARWDRR